MQKGTNPRTAEKYFSSLPKDVKNKLEKIRQIIKREAPNANELISYQMPAFKLNGRILVYYAAWKEHIAIYPFPSSITKFKKELIKYRSSKSTVQFPLDKPLPLELISKIIKFRVKDLQKIKSNKLKK